MIFRKKTIHFSALLFLIFSLTVLSWHVIGFSGSLSLDLSASSTSGNITYDKPSNTITVTGYTSSIPCTFKDVYNADVAGGWGVVTLQGTAQFLFNCNLQVGDASTATFLNDTKKQLQFFTGYAIVVKNKASLTLGILVSSTTKASLGGCQLLFSLTDAYDKPAINLDSVGSSLYLYSSSLTNNNAWYGNRYGVRGASGFSHAIIYNCMFDRLRAVGYLDSTSEVVNIDVYYGGSTVVFCHNSCYIDRVNAINCQQWISFGAASTEGSTTKNVKAVSTSSYGIFVYDLKNKVYVVDCDVDLWTITWGGKNTGSIYRQNEFDVTVTDTAGAAINAATVVVKDTAGNTVVNTTTSASGVIATQTVTRGYYQQSTGDTLQEMSPHTLTITKAGYISYTQVFTLTEKIKWTIALQPLTDGGLIEHVGFVPVDPGLTSPSGTYRWLDVADQAYGIGYRNSYNYSQAAVEVAYCTEGNKLQGLLKARNLKPNFAYQLKLVGMPGTADNERIGLAGRWWQEEWNGTTWSNGQNLNDKGEGSSPNPNDLTYLSRRYIQDSSSPTGYHYRYTGYLVFDHFITDNNGTTTLQFETGGCYHVIWKTTQRSNSTNDGPVKTVTFDPAPSQPAYDTNYPSNTVSIFGEWERLPMGQVNLQPGEYNCQILLTEESFHGSGGTLAGNWGGAVTANIEFMIN